MPKSRQRKNHKQKVKARNNKIQLAKKLYEKYFNQEMSKLLEKMSGETENNETIQNGTEPVL